MSIITVAALRSNKSNKHDPKPLHTANTKNHSQSTLPTTAVGAFNQPLILH